MLSWTPLRIQAKGEIRMRPVTQIASLAVLISLAACGQIRVPGSAGEEAETPAPSVPEQVAEIEAAPETTPGTEDPAVAGLVQTASIDWAAAQRDFANQDTEGDGLVGVASTNNVPVPVLLPEIDFQIASDGPPPLNFTQTPDGYVAVVKDNDYDIIINGTDKLIVASDRAPLPTPEDLRFEETMIGSQVSFSRYGASYLIEFACKDAAPSENCVTEEEAIQAVEDLLLAGTQ